MVKHPEAFARIGKETFLFAPHLEVGVFARALEGEGKGPVCCIGSGVGGYVDGYVSLSPSPFLISSQIFFFFYTMLDIILLRIRDWNWK